MTVKNPGNTGDSTEEFRIEGQQLGHGHEENRAQKAHVRVRRKGRLS
jgi:hypothetical protein